MKRLALLIAMVLISSSPLMAAEGDTPQPPRQEFQQRMQRVQNELREQRQQLDRERQEFHRQQDQMQQWSPAKADAQRRA